MAISAAPEGREFRMDRPGPCGEEARGLSSAQDKVQVPRAALPGTSCAGLFEPQLLYL